MDRKTSLLIYGSWLRYLFNLGDAPGMPAAIKRRGQPYVDDFKRQVPPGIILSAQMGKNRCCRYAPWPNGPFRDSSKGPQRTPWTLLATIASPFPDPPSTIPRSHSPLCHLPLAQRDG